MTVGTPGAGIGGLFYLATALMLPARAIRRALRGERVAWGAVWGQAGLALAILAAIWTAGGLIGLWAGPMLPVPVRGVSGTIARSAGVLATAALYASIVTLGGVLLLVQVARLVVRRRPRGSGPALLAIALLGGGSLEGVAQARPTAAADSAWDRGDRAEARRRYGQVVATHPDDSRAVYRLATLIEAPDSALALYRRYTELEPGDPWGWMALGDALLGHDHPVSAEAAWDEATRLAPADAEVTAARAGFDERLGRWWLRAGRPRRAARLLERAAGGSSAGGCADEACGRAARQLRLARALAGPALEPMVGYQRDSDGNRTSRAGMLGELPVGDGTRLGLSLARASVGDGALAIPTQEGHLYLLARPHWTVRTEFRAGATRLDPGSFGTTWTTPTGGARARWTAPRRGPVVEARVERRPLGTTPALVLNEAVRTDARGLVEVPAGPVRLRGEGRRSWINALGETNRRWGAGGAMVVPVAPGEISAQYQVLEYEQAATVGYFAADRVRTVEAATYLELGDGAPWLVALDAGIGHQRIEPFGEPPGAGKLALRAWVWISYGLGPGRALRLEADGYNSPGAATTATSARWRQGTVTLSLRWAS